MQLKKNHFDEYASTPTSRAYQKNARTVAKNVQIIAKNNMSSARKDITDSQGANENDIVNCSISCDGTWQKGGYSSLDDCIIFCVNYSRTEMLEFGLFDAISHFNIGAGTVFLLLGALKFNPGKYTEQGCRCLDLDCICAAEYKEIAERKKRRKVQRRLKK